MLVKNSCFTPSRMVTLIFPILSGETSLVRLKTSFPSSWWRMPVNVFRPKWSCPIHGSNMEDPPRSLSLLKTLRGMFDVFCPYAKKTLLYNKFIKWFHQSWIPNLRLLWFLFLTCFGPNCLNWDKFVEKTSETNWWKHLIYSLVGS